MNIKQIEELVVEKGPTLNWDNAYEFGQELREKFADFSSDDTYVRYHADDKVRSVISKNKDIIGEDLWERDEMREAVLNGLEKGPKIPYPKISDFKKHGYEIHKVKSELVNPLSRKSFYLEKSPRDENYRIAEQSVITFFGIVLLGLIALVMNLGFAVLILFTSPKNLFKKDTYNTIDLVREINEEIREYFYRSANFYGSISAPKHGADDLDFMKLYVKTWRNNAKEVKESKLSNAEAIQNLMKEAE